MDSVVQCHLLLTKLTEVNRSPMFYGFGFSPLTYLLVTHIHTDSLSFQYLHLYISHTAHVVNVAIRVPSAVTNLQKDCLSY